MNVAPLINHRHLLLSLGIVCIASRVEAVPPRTTEIRFHNQTEHTLTLVKQATPNGSWTPKLAPPAEIKPGAKVMFKSECNGPTGDINANVRYRLGNTGKNVLELYISWSNPFIESSYKNVYHEQGPFGYELYHTGGQGGHAKTDFVFAKAKLHAVPNFKPSTHGFKFSNRDWKRNNIKLPVVAIPFPTGDINITNTAHGMCGGMVYATMDHFYANKPIPVATNAPSSEKDPLFQYLKRRLMKSWDVTGTGHNYLDYMRPTYPDTDEGIPGSGKGRAWIIARQEWPKIKADIDAGQLSPLALVQVKSLSPTDIGSNHQVLAYAYDLSGSRVTLHIYDPSENLDDSVRFIFDIADTSKPINILRMVQGKEARKPINTIFRTNYDRRVPADLNPLPTNWTEAAAHGIAAGDYQMHFDRMSQAGYRPYWIDGYSVGGKVFYNMLFRPKDGYEWIARHALTTPQHEAEFQKNTKAGFRLVHLDCYEADGGWHFASIYSKAPGPAYVTYNGKDSAAHQKEFDKLVKDGFRPTVISVVSHRGKIYHAAIYVKADVGGYVVRPFLTQDEYQKEFNASGKAGRDLVYLNGYNHGGQVRFSAIWHTLAKANPSTRHGMTSAQYQAERGKQGASGQHTEVVTGYEDKGKHYFAAIWKK